MAAPGHALQEKLPSSHPHPFSFPLTTGRGNLPGKCNSSSQPSPPTTCLWCLVPPPATRRAWIWYQQGNHQLEQVEHWVAASHRASHSPWRSLRDRDASTHPPTPSLSGGDPPARPGSLHSILQQATATEGLDGPVEREVAPNQELRALFPAPQSWDFKTHLQVAALQG